MIGTRTEADALKALAELKKGVPFADVAKSCSVDGSRINGGNGPAFVRGRSGIRRIPAFEDAIFRLEPGRQFGPRLFGSVWWIVLCRDKTAADTVPFEQVRAECQESVRIQKGVAANAAAVRSDFEAFRKHAAVQVFWDQYQTSINRPGQKITSNIP